MLSSWGQALRLAIFILNVARSAASLGSDIENGYNSIVSTIESGASTVIEGLEQEFDNFKSAVKSEIVKVLNNSDAILGQFPINLQTTPPIGTQLVTSGIQSNVTVGLYCDSCEMSPPDAFAFASESFTGYNSSWLGIALDYLNASLEINVELTAVENGEIALSLLTISISQDGILVEVEFQLVVLANALESMSFTAGLNLSLENPIGIMIPALDPLVQLNASHGIGFDQGNFNIAPIFNSSLSNLDFSVQLSLRTKISVTVESINVGALYLDLPAFNMTVSTLNNVTSKCQTPPSGTSSKDIYKELINLTGDLNAVLGYELLNEAKSGTIDSWRIHDELNECFAFYPGLAALGNVPDSSNAAVLSATPRTTCTTAGTNSTATGNAALGATLKSLSPGAKAGAVIGTLIGAALISAVSFFIGRFTAQHNPNRSNTRPNSTPAWASVPLSRSKQFFTRSKPTKFSPITPSISSSWENPAYDPDAVPNLDNIDTHQNWQRAKEPFISVNEEAVSPPNTSVSSLGDDYGMPSPASLPSTYETVRGPEQAGQTDGLELLRGMTGSVGYRRDVSRKSVPGYDNRSGSA